MLLWNIATISHRFRFRPSIMKATKPRCFVVNRDGEIEDRPVTLGIQTANDAEVVSGLNEGEQVVVSDRSGLKPGQKVHPQWWRSCGTRKASQNKSAFAARGEIRRRREAMSGFSIRNPYFIIVICLALVVIGMTSLARMPVDLFPTINLPEVVVATFYSGMPPQDIETDITDPLERFFTLASGIDHMESRSLLGVSIIRVYFQPGTSADADVTELSNLALADLKRLPPGTLPPVVLKFDASSLPVCLVTLKGDNLNQTQLHDIGQFAIRNQIAVVKGAEIPPPFGGKYRQVMVYVDPYKLASRQLSPMDVVNAVNNFNLILPAGDVKVGPFRLLRLFEQPGQQHGPTREDSGQDRREFVGIDQRHRRSQGRKSNPIQHGASGWSKVRLFADHEAGGRHQHH